MNENNFISSLLGAFTGGKNRYYKTPHVHGISMLNEGKPELLDPNSWNEYEIYSTTPQLYAVIQRGGNLLASGQWKHYKKNNKGEVVSVENSPYVALLENPNPLMRGNDYIKQWYENRCIYGNNFEFINRGFSTSLPKTLFNLPTNNVSIKTSGNIYRQTRIDEIIKGYEVKKSDKVSEQYATNEINHTRVPNSINPIQGDSPMKAIYMPISNIRSAYQFRSTIMRKKGALGIFSNQSNSMDGAIPLMPEEKLALEKQFQKDYGIADDQATMMFTNASLKFQPISYPTKDLMLFEEVSEDFLTIIDNYGMNDNMFSRSKASTFSNLAEGIKQAYQSTIIPLAEEVAMNRTQILNLPKGEWLEVDYSHITVLQENEKEKAEVRQLMANAYETLFNTGQFTREDLSKIVGLYVV